jgi:hypothetical protein
MILLGFTTSTLDKALQVIHADTQLYIDILSTLQLNQTENMPWDAVVNKIKTLVLANKPQAWQGVDQFLKSLHWGHQEETSTSSGHQQVDVENDDDEIVEMVEGVDYYPDEEDEDELASFPEGEEFDHHYAAFLQGVQEIQAGHHVVDFGKMSVTDHRLVVESC